jgi:penicillin-binding protein-related factor A (putative recombinase)
MGKEQQLAGAALERDLDTFHHGIVGWYVQRNHPKDKRTKGPPDYIAVGHGRALLFDAKSTRLHAWPVALLKPHQAAAFDSFDRAGGRSFIYMRTAEGDAVVWWATFRDRWRRWYTTGHPASLTLADGVETLGGNWTVTVCE